MSGKAKGRKAAAAAAGAATGGDGAAAGHAAPAHTELAKLLGNRTRALLTFEDAGFDASSFLSAYLAPLSEKAIDNAAADLGALLDTATQEARRAAPRRRRGARRPRLHAVPTRRCTPLLACPARPQVQSVVQTHHRRFLEACAGVEALEDQVRRAGGRAPCCAPLQRVLPRPPSR